MKKLAVLAALVVLAACVPIAPPAPAPLTETQKCQAGGQSLVDEWAGLPRLVLPTVECVYSPGQNYLGAWTGTDPATDRVLVNTAWGPLDIPWYHDVVAHEEGHAWDVSHLNDAQRARYAQIRGAASYNLEDYADVYAIVLGGATHVGYGTASPPADQVFTICGEGLMPC